MTPKERLINTLEGAGHDVYLHGTMAADEPYPDEFVTVKITAAPYISHFDNCPAESAWDCQVIYYANDPALVSSVPVSITALLKAAGFIPQGRGTDVLSNEQSHTGWAMEFYFINKEGV